MSSVRLDKLLANLGYGSRKDVQALVRAGLVTQNGTAFTKADERVALAGAGAIQIDGETIDPLPGLTLLLHKPLGVTCSHKEAGPLVYGLLPERWRHREPPLSTIGRLDKETSGLLLLTDDGALLHRVISPKSNVAKRYQVTLARPLRGDEAKLFASGTLMLEGETTPLLPVRMESTGPLHATVTLTEGRYHQVRRMFAAVGNHVEALHRDRVGGLSLLEDLAPGTFRVLTDTDVIFT